ncbi:MAG: ATP-binding protein [Acidobacteriota bacterium]
MLEPRRRSPRRAAAALLLASCVAAPWLPTPAWSTLALLFAITATLLLRFSRRARVFLLIALLVSGSLFSIRGWLDLRYDPTTEDGRGRVSRAYAELWQRLERAAESTAEEIPGQSRQSDALFEFLDSRGPSSFTLMVLDPDGNPRAWSGPGLRLDLEGSVVPKEGSTFVAGFRSVTLAHVVPLDDARRPWRVAAARSYPVDRLPFERDFARGRWPLRWSAVADSAQADPDAVLLVAEGRPGLVVQAAPQEHPEMPWADPWRRSALFALAAALFGAVVAGSRQDPPIAPIFAASAALVLGWSAGAAPATVTIAALGAATLCLKDEWPWRFPPWVSGALAGALGAAVALVAPYRGADAVVSASLEEGFFGSIDVFFGRATVALVVAAVLRLGGARQPARATFRRGSMVLMICALAAALLDLWPLAVSLVVAALAFGAGMTGRRRRWMQAAILGCVAGAILSASADRGALRRQLAARAIEQWGEGPERLARELNGAVSEELARRGLGAILPRSPEALDRQDLAYSLWAASPLARPGVRSTLRVEPFDGPPSSFSFGLAFEREETDAPPSEGAEAIGSVPLTYGGDSWGVVRWRLRLEPGLARSALPAGGLEVELIEDRSMASQDLEGGAVIVSLAALPGEPASGFALRLLGDEWRWLQPLGVGRALALPVLHPVRALVRSGAATVGLLLLAASLYLTARMLTAPAVSLRSLLNRILGSYSTRLVVVYTVLLLIPLIVLDLFLLATIEQRLEREQERRGAQSLDSARRLVTELLATPQPGFGIDRSFADARMAEISEVVRNELNLYWRNTVFASSRSELFAAGLLPKRIPGDVFNALRLEDRAGEPNPAVASRTDRVGDTSYLELYTEVRVPGSRSVSDRFVLSMPLLAEREELARGLTALRRQVLVITAALCALLLAVSVRLARNFTSPLTELVEGTRRIAAGATSLELAPRELELASLVEAVDDMAGKIAAGRARLMREKEVVDRMVDNITSAVVSVDRERRVLMRNQVAAQLLGVQVGEFVDRAFAEREELEPVRHFLRRAGEEAIHETVQVRAARAPGAELEEEEQEWNLVWVPLPGEQEPSALLVVEDVTETVRGQRLEAWAEMARIIAHEIKNPLTPIRLNVEHMRQVRGDAGTEERFGEIFERCTQNVLAQVEELQQIASEFSTYSSILQIELREEDLVAALRELAEPYLTAPPAGVQVAFEAQPHSISARFDRKVLGRAVRNLIENALRASAGGGMVLVQVARTEGADSRREARITVADTGPGVPPELLGRIFDPYFSTHASGTGLGLPIARRVATEHGGTIQARNRDSGGLAVTITIPL